MLVVRFFTFINNDDKNIDHKIGLLFQELINNNRLEMDKVFSDKSNFYIISIHINNVES